MNAFWIQDEGLAKTEKEFPQSYEYNQNIVLKSGSCKYKIVNNSKGTENNFLVLHERITSYFILFFKSYLSIVLNHR